MRCKTPSMRVSAIGFNAHPPSAEVSKNGNQYIRYPNRKMMTVRLMVLRQNTELGCASYLYITNASAFPTANKKEGKTRSVGVKPCQLACKQGRIRQVPTAWRIYDDHETNSHPPKNIEGKVALILRHDGLGFI